MAIQPIILDEFGAILIPLQDCNRAPLTFKFIVGHHQGCTNKHSFEPVIYAHYHSSTHNCLVCQICYLRIIIPNNILPLEITDEVFEPLGKYLARVIELRQLTAKKLENIDMPARWAPASVFDEN